MTPEQMQQLADLLARVPGYRGIDVRDVRKLVDLLRESPDIGSIEVRGLFGTGVLVSRAVPAGPLAFSALPAAAAPGSVPTAVPLHSPSAAAAPAADATAAEPRPAAALKEIRSPMVGTFYAAPEPGAEPYVRVGQRVTVGQTVCIVEAMKIMNEIEAEVSGVVREVCVEDAQPVEYGQVLFRVDPHG
jgi:acetyl-CoA carboxylase biotin carboxyl carrier protein